VLLENAFELDVEPDTAWNLLLDVPRIVPCIPGAELVETRSDTEWTVRIKVKLGSMGLEFLNDVTLEERDEATQTVRLHARGRDVAGRGMVAAGVISQVTEIEHGTRVQMTTDLSISGKMAQFGRGIVADVSASLVESFAACLQTQLEMSRAAGSAAEAEGGGVATAPATSATAAPPAVALSGFAVLRAVLRRRLRRLRAWLSRVRR